MYNYNWKRLLQAAAHALREEVPYALSSALSTTSAAPVTITTTSTAEVAPYSRACTFLPGVGSAANWRFYSPCSGILAAFPWVYVRCAVRTCGSFHTLYGSCRTRTGRVCTRAQIICNRASSASLCVGVWAREEGNRS